MFASTIYRRAPQPVQTSLVALWSTVRESIRERGVYRRQLQALCRTQWLNPASLTELQRGQLSALAKIASCTVPYYRQRDLPRRLPSVDAVTAFPIIDKATVQRNPTAFLSTAHRGIRFSGTTSGSTGTPLRLYLDFRALNLEQAFVARQLAWAGCPPPCRRAWIRGEMIVPVTQTTQPFWRLNRPQQMLMMSSYHLSVANADHYLRALRDHDPVLIQAYPSSIGFLAHYLASRCRYYPGERLRAVVTSSETLTARIRRVIEERFGCRVFDWYGARERVVAIGQCEHGSYHLIADYGFTELASGPDGWSEIVATGFTNRLMPLIRYRTGDHVKTANGVPCPCGRHFPTVHAVAGRRDDYLRTPDGRFVGRMDHIFKNLAGIAEAQIVQERFDDVRIRVVALPAFDSQAARQLRRRATDRLGPAVRVTVERVKALPRNRQGKLQTVVCRVRTG